MGRIQRVTPLKWKKATMDKIMITINSEQCLHILEKTNLIKKINRKMKIYPRMRKVMLHLDQ